MGFTFSELRDRVMQMDVHITDIYDEDTEKHISFIYDDTVKIHADNTTHIAEQLTTNIIIKEFVGKVDPNEIEAYSQFTSYVPENISIKVRTPHEIQLRRISSEKDKFSLDELQDIHRELDTEASLYIKGTQSSVEDFESVDDLFTLADEIADTTTQIQTDFPITTGR